jgi:hypothetical protein
MVHCSIGNPILISTFRQIKNQTVMKKTNLKTELLLVVAALVILAAVLTSCYPVRPASSVRYCPPVRGSR